MSAYPASGQSPAPRRGDDRARSLERVLWWALALAFSLACWYVLFTLIAALC